MQISDKILANCLFVTEVEEGGEWWFSFVHIIPDTIWQNMYFLNTYTNYLEKQKKTKILKLVDMKGRESSNEVVKYE